MTPTIRTTFQTTTPESVADGDYAETGFENEKGDEIVADEDETIVGLAVKYMGNVEPSCWPSWSPGTWYTQTEGTRDRAYFEEGEETTLSFHLDGFTEVDERAIFDAVKARR